MTWQQWMRNFIVYHHGVNPYVKEADLVTAVLAMPPANRIALARELLAGTGRVVAREVDEYGPEYDDATRASWNACRAAMLDTDDD